MYRITFALDALGDVDLALREIDVLLEALTQANLIYLQAHPELLRERHMFRHEAEPQGAKNAGQEDWQDAPTLFRPKASGLLTASDRDLACLRAASLQLRGTPAQPHVYARRNGARTEIAIGLLGEPSSVMHWRALGTPQHPTRMRITFVLGLFEGDKERELSNQILQVLLDALTEIDVLLLERHPEIPSVYTSGVRYVEEPPMQEDWQDAATCLRMGRADCDDLAPWIAAERRVRQDIPARATWNAKKMKRGKDTFYLYHITTQHPDGRREDPSYIQGMR